jgi:DNA-binding PadR family transcriptional regulator
VSSNSLGSIQAAVKKLLSNGMIEYDEFVEGGVNKKIYALTDRGKAYFIESVSKPMRSKERNMELGKLFFMGFAPKGLRPALLESYIDELEAEKEKLERIRAASQDTESSVADYIRYLQESGRLESFEDMLRPEPLPESLRDISLFQFATLELAISKLEFEILWFRDFLRERVAEQ